MRAVLVVLVTFGCGPRNRLTVHAPEKGGDVYAEYVQRTAHPFVEVDLSASPRARGGGLHAVIVDNAIKGCEGCYRLERVSDRVVEIRAGDPLGAQYGLTALLEEMDFRFIHPHATFAPYTLELPEGKGIYGVDHKPEIARRGLHLHTLHPTEGMMDFWVPGEGELDRAKRVVDWTVRNRGNHLQWVGLDDIQSGSASDWREHTQAINDYAHQRGITTGLGIQLFGNSNLQLAWDLVDDPGNPAAEDAEMRARLAVIGDVGFDVLNLSFGEFFGADPADFIDATERAYDAMQEVAGPVEVPAVIHVGNFDDLRVEWQGEDLLYYFLAAETDRDIKPWIHTVMYYNLFEDAGGAYLHDAFDEHRDFLLDALQAGEPVGYFPETAYWVAFDINVPTYLPLYVRSRWTDLDRIDAAGPGLQDHVIFSSGWEWGYWQNDYATLRASYERPAQYEDLFEALFAPYGKPGAALSQAVIDLADLQHQGLIERRLAAYMGGREAVIDLGDNLGIVSQPDRPKFSEVAEYSPAEAVAFEAILQDLAAHGAGTRAIAARIKGIDLDAPFLAEIADGAEIDALRAEFAHAVFAAALKAGQGGSPAAELALARAGLENARAVVASRHSQLWDPLGDRLLDPALDNPTIYDFGYLARADELCFWERELAQVSNLLEGGNLPVPPCT